jgi:hypothetical protein
MRMRPAFVPLVLTAALGSAGIAAAGSFDATGIARGDDHLTVYPVTRDLVEIVGSADYQSFEGAQPDNPFNGVRGPCFGAMELDHGKLSGSGYCTYKDPEDATVIIRWTANRATAQGTAGEWKLVGGSGKWAKGSGGGTYEVTTDHSHFQNAIAGSVTLRGIA